MYQPTIGRTVRIVDDEITPNLYDKVISKLEDFMKQDALARITLEIYSNGGNCAAGFALCRWILANKVPIQTVGYGKVDSMAVPILLVAEPTLRYCSRECTILLHPIANVYDAKATRDIVGLNRDMSTLKKVQSEYVDFVHERSSLKKKDIRALIDQETRLTARKAKKLGFVNAILG